MQCPDDLERQGTSHFSFILSFTSFPQVQPFVWPGTPGVQDLPKWSPAALPARATCIFRAGCLADQVGGLEATPTRSCTGAKLAMMG